LADGRREQILEEEVRMHRHRGKNNYVSELKEILNGEKMKPEKEEIV
jgi:hypothetical protein